MNKKEKMEKKVVLPEVNKAAKQMNTKIIDTLDILNAAMELNFLMLMPKIPRS